MTQLIEFVCSVVDPKLLNYCAYEYPESYTGACDGQPCWNKATVHDMGTEQDYCEKHYKEVSRG